MKISDCQKKSTDVMFIEGEEIPVCKKHRKILTDICKKRRFSYATSEISQTPNTSEMLKYPVNTKVCQF